MIATATIPQTGGAGKLLGVTFARQPGLTHRVDTGRARVCGMTDGKDALMQAVWLILNVERYAYPIYSRNYGAELSDLIGTPKDYAMSEMKRRITEALLQDDRITAVGDWSFDEGPHSVTAHFTVSSVYGGAAVEKEVEI